MESRRNPAETLGSYREAITPEDPVLISDLRERDSDIGMGEKIDEPNMELDEAATRQKKIS